MSSGSSDPRCKMSPCKLMWGTWFDSIQIIVYSSLIPSPESLISSLILVKASRIMFSSPYKSGLESDELLGYFSFCKIRIESQFKTYNLSCYYVFTTRKYIKLCQTIECFWRRIRHQEHIHSAILRIQLHLFLDFSELGIQQRYSYLWYLKLISQSKWN